MNTKASYFTPEQKNEFSIAYESLKPKYEALCKEVSSIIGFFFSENKQYKYASITYRTKDTESFLGKLDRKLYLEPFDEIDDFAGVRVVLYRISDIPVIESFLAEEFSVKKVENKSKQLGASEMGYGGTHMVVSLGSNYNGAKHRGIKKLRCEIQIRTVLQDAWSTISHSLLYKTHLSMPINMQREFNNLSSLLEIADSNFERIIRDKEVLAAEAREESQRSSFLTLPISVERLAEYSASKFPNLPIDEFWQETLASDIQQIDGFKTLRDIDNAVQNSRRAVEAYKTERPDLFKSSTDHLTKSVGFVSEKFRAIHPFAAATLNAFGRHHHLVEVG